MFFLTQFPHKLLNADVAGISRTLNSKYTQTQNRIIQVLVLCGECADRTCNTSCVLGVVLWPLKNPVLIYPIDFVHRCSGVLE